MGTDSRVRVEFGLQFSGFYRLLPWGYPRVFGFCYNKCLNIGFRVGFDFIGFGLFPLGVRVFRYPTSSLIPNQRFLMFSERVIQRRQEEIIGTSLFFFFSFIVFYITKSLLLGYIQLFGSTENIFCFVF